MSTFRKPDGDGLTVERAGHAGANFDAFEELCGKAIRSAAVVGYLAHYTSNVFDLGVDNLSEPPGEPNRVPGTTGRDELRRAGRSLCFTIGRLEDELLAARTGALVRILIHTTTGAALCNAILPGQNAVFFMLRNAGSRPWPEMLSEIAGQRSTDLAVANLVLELRRRYGKSATTDVREADPPIPAANEPATSPPVHTAEFTEPSGESCSVLTACQEAVKPTALHLVSRCTEGKIAFMVDCLDANPLRPFLAQTNADARRKFYLAHAREIGSMATTLGRTTHTALGGGLVFRMILDVEQSSIFYYRLSPGDYLVGVTIDPAAVDQADDEMANLANVVLGLLHR